MSRPGNKFTDIEAAIEEAEWLATEEKRQYYVVQTGHEMLVTKTLRGKKHATRTAMYRTSKRGPNGTSL